MTATTRDALLVDLAAELRTAAATRQPVEPLTERFPGLGVDEAYAVQELNASARQAAGDPVVGRKIGLTSKAMQEMLGVAEPDYGRIYASELLPSGASVRRADLIAARVEPEIAFIMAHGLRGPDVTSAEVLAATEAVAPALEVIDSRVADWRIKLVDTVADNASCARVVLGRQRTDPAEVDLATAAVHLRVDGDVVQEGTGAAVLGHPAEAVAWLVRTLHRYGGGLAGGDVVMPGSMTAAVPFERGSHVVADFGALGTVEVLAR
ncbi:MAG: fumarylacetoacetate hydrolase family protein [Solirubrobacterales bacterium]|nr:fumarylacetoacetate hydrolase family protein [Solirubrobacterales bacterium]